jgi:exodeoxyribonuclease-3
VTATDPEQTNRKAIMKIITWNINSVRKRLDLLKDLLVQEKPDVICLQETKVQDADFPLSFFEETGYGNVLFQGQKSYNGVAIASPHKLAPVSEKESGPFMPTRCIGAKLENGVRVFNFYVPAGGDEPDPKVNDKFRDKLDFMEAMSAWSTAIKNPIKKSVLVGDLNVAPSEQDVWSHKQLLKIVSHTPVETEALAKIMASGNWLDAVREHFGDDEKLYSWWSYRARDWRAANKGRRLDHIWMGKDLKKTLTGAAILDDVRGWDTPSYHAPILAEFDV